MLHRLFLTVIALCCSAVLVNGQCTLPSCTNSATVSGEVIATILEEHDDKLQSMYKTLSSAFEQVARNLEKNDQTIKQHDQSLSSQIERNDRSLRRNFKAQDENLKAIYHNISSLFEILSGGIEEENKCYKIEDQRQYLEIMNFSVKVERIQVQNEDLERRFEAYDESVSLAYQNISTKIEENLNQHLKIIQQTMSNTSIEDIKRIIEVHGQTMVLAYQNVSIKIDKIHENCQENDERQNQNLVIMQRTISNISTKDLERRLEVHDQSMRLIYQNVSTQIDKIYENDERQHQNISVQIDEKLNQHMKTIQQTLSNVSMKYDAKFDSLKTADDNIIAQVIEHDRRLQIMQDTFSSVIENLTVKLNAVLDHVNESLEILKFQDHCGGNPGLCDCSTIKANGYTSSGVYRIYVDNQYQRYHANAYCDMTTANGAWTIFQSRKDGRVDFYRGWNDYANGFGDPNGEFWLGNDFIHRLTSKRTYRLRIDLEDFDGNGRYAEYSTISISSSADKYRLRIGNYSGTAGDSLNNAGDFGKFNHNGRQFSTKGADNDGWSSGDCALDHRGAWWYNCCHNSNLNGIYKRGRYLQSDCAACGIVWSHWRGYLYSLKTTKMKISPAA